MANEQYRSSRLAGITKSYELAVAHGEVPGHVMGTRVGTNNVISPTAFMLLSNLTTPAVPFILPAAAQQMQVVSSSASDTGAGTGAQQVEITYLTNVAAGFAKKTEIVTLNGTTPVVTAASDIFRIDRFKVSRGGSAGFPAGNISLQSVGGASTYERIDAGTNVFRSAIHWIPKGFRTTVTDMEFGASTAGGIKFILEASEEDASGNVVTVGQKEIELSDSSFEDQIRPPVVVENLNGLMKAIAIVVLGKAGNQSGSGSFSFIDSPL